MHLSIDKILAKIGLVKASKYINKVEEAERLTQSNESLRDNSEEYKARIESLETRNTHLENGNKNLESKLDYYKKKNKDLEGENLVYGEMLSQIEEGAL